MTLIKHDWNLTDWTKKDTEIASQAGCSREYVRQRRVRAGLPSRRGIQKPLPYGFTPGRTIIETAVKYNVHDCVAKYWMSLSGAPLAKRGPKPGKRRKYTAPESVRPTDTVKEIMRVFEVPHYTAVMWKRDAEAKAAKPDHENQIQLIGYYGSDTTHACSAWTSTNRDLTPEKEARIPALLKQLAGAGHYSPFEKSALHFLLTVEQASHIHLLKHRVGVSINGESARYKELKDDRFFVPADWPKQSREMLEDHCMTCFKKYHQCLYDLEAAGISRKRAKESARFFLPYASQIQLDVSFNWRSFHHFLGLRKKPDAQREIHDIAAQMLALVAGIKGNPFKHTLAAFGYEGGEA